MANTFGNRPFLLGQLVSLLTLLLCLAVAEVVTRRLNLAPEIYLVQEGRFRISENPLIGYELVPHFESPGSGPMLDFGGKSNSLGFRDREHPIAKQTGVYRILVLGDSITQGLGIFSSRDIFTSVLESQLNRGQPGRFEVMNFGVSGYNTQQEVESLSEKGLRYSPDLVVLAYCVNDNTVDSGNILQSLEEERQERRIVRTPELLMNSALFRLAYSIFTTGWSDSGDEFEAIRRNTVSEYLDVLAELSRDHDFEVLVIWFPRLDRPPDEDNRRQLNLVSSASATHGFHLLDLSHDLAACAEQGPVALNALHPNRRGHRCAGSAIARHVTTRVRPETSSETSGAPRSH